MGSTRTTSSALIGSGFEGSFEGAALGAAVVGSGWLLEVVTSDLFLSLGSSLLAHALQITLHKAAQDAPSKT
jgi:hypothetical protein